MMFKLLRKYRSLEKIERKILNRTIFWLFYSFMLVRLIPLKWFNSLLGEFRETNNTILNETQLHVVEKLLRNIKRIKKRLPWEVKCFEEAITAKKLLEKNNIKSTIYLGVSRESENNLIAHAWLKSGDRFITGEKGHRKFSVVGYYS